MDEHLAERPSLHFSRFLSPTSDILHLSQIYFTLYIVHFTLQLTLSLLHVCIITVMWLKECTLRVAFVVADAAASTADSAFTVSKLHVTHTKW